MDLDEETLEALGYGNVHDATYTWGLERLQYHLDSRKLAREQYDASPRGKAVRAAWEKTEKAKEGNRRRNREYMRRRRERERESRHHEAGRRDSSSSPAQ